MIVIKIIGGLGNQIFQYAIARQLSIMRNEEFKLDISAFSNYKLRNYLLSNFNIIENIIDIKDIIIIKNKFSLKHLLYRKRNNAFYLYKEKLNFIFDKDVFITPGNLYLDGYWQAEKYFTGIREILLKEISVKNKPSLENIRMLSSIKSTNSVAIHVRRQDYITNPNAFARHGTCGLEYYKKCIKLMSDNISDPTFYLFSDDPVWVEKNFPSTDSFIVVKQNGDQYCYEDLRLMSNCSHFIIANSSFSWWGAWLSRNKNKIVLAPKRWIRQKNVKVLDLIPSDWKTVSEK